MAEEQAAKPGQHDGLGCERVVGSRLSMGAYQQIRQLGIVLLLALVIAGIFQQQHAAFRQGLQLMHGCKEGQCSACKCYLLEGEVSLKKYSTFALSESEEANGYSLLCRAMPDEDLVIELLHFDPDGYKMDHEIRDGRAVVAEIEELGGEAVPGTVALSAGGLEATPDCNKGRSAQGVNDLYRRVTFALGTALLSVGAETL